MTTPTVHQHAHQQSVSNTAFVVVDTSEPKHPQTVPDQQQNHSSFSQRQDPEAVVRRPPAPAPTLIKVYVYAPGHREVASTESSNHV